MHKLKSSQQVYSIQAFQNGRFALLEIPSREKRFSLLGISERCLFLSATVHEGKKFVRFAWSGNLSEFLCLCFGLGPAPRIFSKPLKVPIALLRRLNIRLVIYLDDIPLMGRTDEFLMSRDILIFLLQHLGFVIKLKKSVLKPSQQIDFLGLKIDTHTMTLALTEEKMKCQNLLSHSQTTVLELTELISLISSTVQAVLPARLQLRYLQQQQIQSLNQACSYRNRNFFGGSKI